MWDLPAGRFELSASSAQGTARIDTIALSQGEQRTGIVLEIAGRGTVTGQLVALGTGEPVAGMRVFAFPVRGSDVSWRAADKQRITGADGRFRIDDAPAGRLTIRARPLDSEAAAFSGGRVIATVQAGSVVDIGDIQVPRRRIEPRERPGELGFTLVELEPDQDPADVELKVALVRAGGPAVEAGLRAGDVIVSVDGNDVRGEKAYLYHALAAVPEGTSIILGLARGDAVKITARKPR
jgi:hypothetical protein